MGEVRTSHGLRLSTARLTLEPVQQSHAERLFALMRDDRLTTFLAWEPHTRVEQTQALITALSSAIDSGKGYHWTVLEGDYVRGLISVIDVQRAHRSWRVDRGEIAYWVAPDQQGRGLATEAAEAVVTFAFEHLRLNRLRISHTSANPASGRIPQKLGFRFVGTEFEFFQKHGVWHDMNHYEMLARDWAHRHRGSR